MSLLVHEAWVWVFMFLGVIFVASLVLAIRGVGDDDFVGAVAVLFALGSGIVLVVLLAVFCGETFDRPRTVDLSTKAYAHKGRRLECTRCRGLHDIWQDWDVTPNDAWAKYAVACRWCGYQIKGGEEPPRGKEGVPVWTVIVGFAAGLAGGACLSFLSRLWRIGKALVKGGSKMMAMLEAAAEKDEKKG